MARSVSVASLVSIGEAGSDGGCDIPGCNHGSVSSHRNSFGAGGGGGAGAGGGVSIPRTASFSQRQSPTTATVGFNIPDGDGSFPRSGPVPGGGGEGASFDNDTMLGESLGASFQSRTRFSPVTESDRGGDGGSSSNAKAHHPLSVRAVETGVVSSMFPPSPKHSVSPPGGLPRNGSRKDLNEPLLGSTPPDLRQPGGASYARLVSRSGIQRGYGPNASGEFEGGSDGGGAGGIGGGGDGTADDLLSLGAGADPVFDDPELEKEYRQRESVLVALLLGVSFTSAFLIAAPMPILPQKLAEYGYGPMWNGVVFSAFALSVVCSSHFFNRFSGIDNGRTALMVVGLFLQGAGG
eukprot:CAMPEP_0181388450 /NCGR_PEP_ID=MMETSP1106-20121128/24316_1 /TAXON_ID=81844 /ORGANISM="Mantoniella antarctica, Strain SL-175" /LENGTH=350 /DNA_ID=CAMNT_0023509011 /DNA_START=279 /DNA_END=1329 /DNA_ORIENTATION=-